MLADFLTYLEAERRYSALTVRNYRRDIERFLTWLRPDGAPFDPAELRTEDVREWIVSRIGRDKISAASMNREISSLRTWWRYLRRQGVVTRDIFQGVGSLKASRRLPSFVPKERMMEVLADVDRQSGQPDFREVRDAVIVAMFYGCGIRLSELVGLDRSAFSDDLRQIRVLGKGGKVRIVPIVEPLRRLILRYLQAIRSCGICDSRENALFLSRSGRRISRSSVQRLVGRVLDEAGVIGKKSPHVLRHTFATLLLDHGADMREIQELLGHASLQATQVYTHNSIGRLLEVYATAHPRERGGGSNGM